MKRSVSRRRFMHGVATVGGAAFLGPYVMRAAEPNKDKLRIGFVGTGGRAGSHVKDHLNAVEKRNDEICTAYTDVDQKAWEAIAKGQPQAKAYTDYRKMFEKHAKEIDAVFVAVPDHHHAPAAMRAIRNGMHVYCEKPLTWCVSEARALAEAAVQYKVATQMGNQGHANQGNRRIVEWVRNGLIGDVLEVHSWTNRPVWPQGVKERPPEAPVPEGLDWESWIGPAPMRPFALFSDESVIKKGRGKSPYHPFNWRGWFDFGCGAIGDMGCHTWDSVFWSLNPDYPSSLELLEIIDGNQETFPSKSHFVWNYPAKGNRPAFVAHWYDGGLKPAVPEEVLNDPSEHDPKKPNKPIELSGSGNLYIGTKGKLYNSGDYGDHPRLIPKTFMESTKEKRDAITPIEKSPGHREEFIMAARGEKPIDYPGSNFPGYASPLTENMLLGAILQRIGKVGFKIECDAVKRTILTKEALAFASRDYRPGWGL